MESGMTEIATNPEPRWPAMLALLAVGGLRLALPEYLSVGPNWLLILVVTVLMIPTVWARWRKNYTLNQTLTLLEKISGRSARANYAAPRAGDIRDSQADIALAREKLGYEPSVGFEEGLRRTWEWFAAQR